MMTISLDNCQKISAGLWAKIRTFAFFYVALHIHPAFALDLSDCDLLLNKKPPAEFSNWKARTDEKARQGDQKSILYMAAESNNRLSCWDQQLTGRSEWDVVKKSDGVTKSQLNSGIPQINQHPEAWKALTDAVFWTHLGGQQNLSLRLLSANLVLKYNSVLPEAIETAYLDAAGAYAYHCVLKRQPESRQQDFSCGESRRVRATLTPLVQADKRTVLDEQASLWAAQVK